MYCLACVLFPVSAKRTLKAKALISEPYSNWKDAKHDITKHSLLDYHKESFAKMSGFIETYEHPNSRIDLSMNASCQEQVIKNQTILKSILHCIEFCGRQGLSLRGHQEHEPDSKTNHGHFLALVDFRVKSGDAVLQNHLETGKKNAMYMSPTAQNDLLQCIKEYVVKIFIIFLQ